MTCDEYGSLAYLASGRNAPYISSSVNSSSSSLTSTSVWSDTSSHHSDESSVSAPSSDSECADSFCHRVALTSQRSCEPVVSLTNPWLKQQTGYAPVEVPSELRKNPRRTSHSSTTRTGCPPPLVRQADRKVNFVDNLVDSATQIVEAVWPTSSVNCRSETGGNAVLPLRTFIQETLRRSRTSYSTLQVALYYLVLIKPFLPARDFTMEQFDDCHASRALQCGRRMFLAALILASKYLQDRNYSARAWSKISGLATQEINQNEMAFLLTVNWKLHVTDEVYNRWTECVMKHTPSQPPSPGGAGQRVFEQQCEDFKNIILGLNPELDNLEDLLPRTPMIKIREPMASPPTLFTPSSERCPSFSPDADATPVCKSIGTPSVMEPSPATVYMSSRSAPALGLLPTPRMTPQNSVINAPAVNVAGYLLGKGSSMGFAMSQATGSQNMDLWPVSTTSSPRSYVSTRRSSLANSISTASSPESMVSDSSRTSRCSSISSSSSWAFAPSSKLDVLARCRSAKLCSGLSLKPTIAEVPEDFEETFLTSSPESFTGTVGKDSCGSALDMALGRRECEMESAAARALHQLQFQSTSRVEVAEAAPRPSLKRSRAVSSEKVVLQDNVRNMLKGRQDHAGDYAWSDTLVRPRYVAQMPQVPFRATSSLSGRKRVCCSVEAAEGLSMPSIHTALGGPSGPGMWENILH